MSEVNIYTENELVQAVKEKDKNAFSYLYKNYANIIFGTISRIIIDTTIAEDTMQEVFVKIWTNIHQYDASKGKLFTWMINLTKNYAIDVIRSKSFKQQKLISANEEVVYNVSEETNSFEKLDKIAFQKTIYILNKNHQQIVNLIYFQGYKQEEVATLLNIPLGTVKSRVRLAILELRKIMTKNN